MTVDEKVADLIEIGKELADDCGSPYRDTHSVAIAYSIAVEVQDAIENEPVLLDADYPRIIFPNQEKKEFWDSVVSKLQEKHTS